MTVSILFTACPALFAGKRKNAIHRVFKMYLDSYLSRFLVPQIARASQASFSIRIVLCLRYSSFVL